VASDLDGTIVRPDGTVSARTVAALQDCLARGIGVVFVTGRPTRWMAPVAEATGHHGVAVCGNGAVIYDLDSERVLSTRALSVTAVLAAAEALRGALPGVVFALETLDGYRREPGYLVRDPSVLSAPCGPLADLLQDGPVVTKLLCRQEGGRADPMLALARSALAGIAEPVHSNAEDSMLEIAALGVSKASTLALIAADRQILPDEVVAFGDMPNDVPMLRWAGRGYAMASGHREAIEAADDVAPPCLQDGVAQVIERLLGRPSPS